MGRDASDSYSPDFPEINLNLSSQDLVNQQALEIYIDEAKFFWRFLRPLLSERLPNSALEVGSGIGCLSLLTKKVVDSVTSIEPESAGFDRMSELRRILVRAWGDDDLPCFRKGFVSQLPPNETFDFIFCLNVLEHVPQPESLIAEIYGRLRPGGLAWFVLPNYSFPYEQHFEIPILFSKSITEKMFRNRISNHAASPDPWGLWAELSWPTQKRLVGFLRSRGWRYEFRRVVLGGYFDRLDDPFFVQRKGNIYRFLRPLIKMMRSLTTLLPHRTQPLIEFTISKDEVEASRVPDQ